MRCSSFPKRVVPVTARELQRAPESAREPQRAPESFQRAPREPQGASRELRRAPESENVQIHVFFKAKAMHRHT